MKPKSPPKATPSPGRPKDAAKRGGIVAAASSLFISKGYQLTSMEAVAKKADVSKLTIYSHFADKDELFKQVIRQRCDKMVMPPESFITLVNEPVRESLLRLGGNFVKMIYAPDFIRLHRTMQGESARHPKIAQLFYEAGPSRVRMHFADLLKEWVGQKKLDISDTVKATEQFFSLLKGELMSKLMLGCSTHLTPKEMDAHVKSTVDFFLAAYKPRK